MTKLSGWLCQRLVTTINTVGSTTSFKPVMNNIAVILHVNSRPFYVFYYDVKRGEMCSCQQHFPCDSNF